MLLPRDGRAGTAGQVNHNALVYGPRIQDLLEHTVHRICAAVLAWARTSYHVGDDPTNAPDVSNNTNYCVTLTPAQVRAAPFLSRRPSDAEQSF